MKRVIFRAFAKLKEGILIKVATKFESFKLSRTQLLAVRVIDLIPQYLKSWWYQSQGKNGSNVILGFGKSMYLFAIGLKNGLTPVAPFTNMV